MEKLTVHVQRLIRIDYSSNFVSSYFALHRCFINSNKLLGLLRGFHETTSQSERYQTAQETQSFTGRKSNAFHSEQMRFPTKKVGERVEDLVT
ncbi:hypothetical protein DICVIV_10887 [Dictyocaulus viviparus]|uniref:N-terminal Ras-GEF domain-containing protein n=1 Tax=Dictyocaulus viviparus TaxID=29172 RepID=A0A0D8XHB1_DICVI|nr:hypothetical protein DICVIV_10887 [Dictyocaulus viviparus]